MINLIINREVTGSYYLSAFIGRASQINNKMAKFETNYERLWDNPINKDGSKKEAKILGEFEIVETLREDSYTSQKIGVLKDTDKVFIISEYEVIGFGGGSRFEVLECKSLQCRTALHITTH